MDSPGHLAVCMTEIRNAYNTEVGKYEGERLFCKYGDEPCGCLKSKKEPLGHLKNYWSSLIFDNIGHNTGS